MRDILFGTYELLNCSTLNGQVGRRSEDIHLTPYQLDEAEDVTEFIRVIRTLEKHLPLEEEPYLAGLRQKITKKSLKPT
jgi:hypothetical protein